MDEFWGQEVPSSGPVGDGKLSRREVLQASGAAAGGIALSGLAPIAQPRQPRAIQQGAVGSEPVPVIPSGISEVSEYTAPPLSPPNEDTLKYCALTGGIVEGVADNADLKEASRWAHLATVNGWTSELRKQCVNTGFYHTNYDTIAVVNTWALINILSAGSWNLRNEDGWDDSKLTLLNPIDTYNFYLGGTPDRMGVYVDNRFLRNWKLNSFGCLYDTHGKGSIKKVLFTYPWVSNDPFIQSWDSGITSDYRRGSVFYQVGEGNDKMEDGITLLFVLEGEGLDQTVVHTMGGARVNGPSDISGNEQKNIVYGQPLRPERPFPPQSPFESGFRMGLQLWNWAADQTEDWKRSSAEDIIDVPSEQIPYEDAVRMMGLYSVSPMFANRRDRFSNRGGRRRV